MYLPRLEAAAAISVHSRSPGAAGRGQSSPAGGAGTDSHRAQRRMLLLFISFFGHLWSKANDFCQKGRPEELMEKKRALTTGYEDGF